MNLRLGMRPFATAIGLVVLAGHLSAQTAPLPILPPEPEPTPQPTPQPDGQATPRTAVPDPRQPAATEAEPNAQPRPRPWELGLGAGLGWDSNIDFIRPDGPASTTFSPRGDVARNLRSARGRLRAAAEYRWAGYPYQQELNRSYVDFALAGDYRTSSHTTWWIDSSYDFGYSDASSILTQQGVAFALVKTRTLSGNLGLIQRLGTRTVLRLDGRIYRVEFDAPGIATGQSLRGTMLLEYKLSPRNTGAVVYSLEQLLNGAGEPYPSHYGALQWTRVLAPRVAILVEGGASYTPAATLVGLAGPYGFFGGASLIRQIDRSTITALFRREVAPAFGFGVSLMASRAGLRVDLPIGRDWRIGMTADYARPDNAEQASLSFPPNTDASLIVGRVLSRQLELAGETRYRHHGAADAVPEISSFQVGVFLNFLPQGRRGGSLPGR